MFEVKKFLVNYLKEDKNINLSKDKLIYLKLIFDRYSINIRGKEKEDDKTIFKGYSHLGKVKIVIVRDTFIVEFEKFKYNVYNYNNKTKLVVFENGFNKIILEKPSEILKYLCEVNYSNECLKFSDICESIPNMNNQLVIYYINYLISKYNVRYTGTSIKTCGNEYIPIIHFSNLILIEIVSSDRIVIKIKNNFYKNKDCSLKMDLSVNDNIIDLKVCCYDNENTIVDTILVNFSENSESDVFAKFYEYESLLKANELNMSLEKCNIPDDYILVDRYNVFKSIYELLDKNRIAIIQRKQTFKNLLSN